MADQNSKYPDGTQLLYPDGSVYCYVQASEDIEPGIYVELNVNARLVKMRGGIMKFPWGITQENVNKNWYTFVLVRPPKQLRDTPVIG